LVSDPSKFPQSVLLLAGPPGSGKTAYCIQFLHDGLNAGEDCMYLSCTPAIKENVIQSYFQKSRAPNFLSLFVLEHGKNRTRNLAEAIELVSAWLGGSHESSEKNRRFVLDSLTDLIARFSQESVQKFIVDLYDLLKVHEASAVFTVAGTGAAPGPVADIAASLLDGVIQLRQDEPSSGGKIERALRLFSHKSARHNLGWVSFTIDQDNGRLHFGTTKKISDAKADLFCKLCDGPILGGTSSDDSLESQYHPHCLDTYRKLSELYGSHILYALEPGVTSANFFFIDIVGLSNPLLSVENQIKKIEDLNMLIRSCDAYNKVPKDKKIVLPTGDGMAIGFLLNPELPLQLSMQLHRKLREFNARHKAPDDSISVRIGLSTGPVFVVSDVNNNQNVWGPGIILARRVMDLGDDGHILLADNIAETLSNLKDDYKRVIKLISGSQKIKHGQSLRLYSAHSDDFGNPATPSKLTSP
jgi:KaiC/GvpD/RAD55 family RecA-like ATPase